MNEIKTYTEKEKLMAAYALNMCTVSVSQIIDYNDIYILEQEYEAILNNLNLERMPKDEALLNILVQLLNTIDFFRIQDIKKKEIEKEYQKKMKNAIWSAIPNIGVIISNGNPVMMAASLATQLGSGYMNYRKEKATVQSEKEKEELELRITAMEQFHALRRELFTTAWRLADEYGFKDEYRLTEKQIKQYNEILMDQNEFRKYERLEAIKDKFEAYPPFWYFFGHSAAYIAGNAEFELSEKTRHYYIDAANNYFEKYYQYAIGDTNDAKDVLNILREDQLMASFALEYADLLLLKENPDTVKIERLLNTAIKMAGNSNDIIQLCVIAFLKVGKFQEAEKWLKILVNEGYNETTNAKLLSRLLVSRYLATKSDDVVIAYDSLKTRVSDDLILFPMPKEAEEDDILQDSYLHTQKIELVNNYCEMFLGIIQKYTVLFNRVLPIEDPRIEYKDSYFDNSAISRERRFHDVEELIKNREVVESFGKISFSTKFLGLLNKMLNDLDQLSLFRDIDCKEDILLIIKQNCRDNVSKMETYQAKLADLSFKIDDYKNLQRELSFKTFTKDFFETVMKYIAISIQSVDSLKLIDDYDMELVEFCVEQNIELNVSSGILTSEDIEDNYYLEIGLIGKENDFEQEKKERMLRVIELYGANLLKEKASETFFIRHNSPEFHEYFRNSKLSPGNVKLDTLAIIDDRSKRDFDLLFTLDGFRIAKKNKVSDPIGYDKANFILDGGVQKISFSYWNYFSNEEVDFDILYRMNVELKEIK